MLVVIQVEEMALPGDGDWWGVKIEVPRTAAQLDFVLSDSEERSWDNNGQVTIPSLPSLKFQWCDRLAACWWDCSFRCTIVPHSLRPSHVGL